MLQQQARQQTQFLTLSPMPGQEFSTGGAGGASRGSTDLGVGVQGITATLMDHTPTTSSMLAALQGTSDGTYGGMTQQQHQQHPLANVTNFSPADSVYYDTPFDTNGPGAFDMTFFQDQPTQHQQQLHSASASPMMMGPKIEHQLPQQQQQHQALSPAGSSTSGNGGLDVPAGAVEDLRRRESEEGGAIVVKNELDIPSNVGM